mmetsp:Transcript_17462/g.34314  ORF Transcript_17462/g.34314 Transcript_17462/m.34314 type:complete len:295 (+) Transcript_17462:478-1362(+)
MLSERVIQEGGRCSICEARKNTPNVQNNDYGMPLSRSTSTGRALEAQDCKIFIERGLQANMWTRFTRAEYKTVPKSRIVALGFATRSSRQAARTKVIPAVQTPVKVRIPISVSACWLEVLVTLSWPLEPSIKFTKPCIASICTALAICTCSEAKLAFRAGYTEGSTSVRCSLSNAEMCKICKWHSTIAVMFTATAPKRISSSCIPFTTSGASRATVTATRRPSIPAPLRSVVGSSLWNPRRFQASVLRLKPIGDSPGMASFQSSCSRAISSRRVPSNSIAVSSAIEPSAFFSKS